MTYINKVILPKVKKKEELKKCQLCGNYRTSNRGLYCIDCKVQRMEENRKRQDARKQLKRLSDFERKWGEVCTRCHKRKGFIMSTPGTNLPKGDSGCQCDEKH